MKNKIFKFSLVFACIILLICSIASNSMGLTMSSFVYYNGKIYFQEERIYLANETKKEAFLGEYLGKTQGWSSAGWEMLNWKPKYNEFDSVGEQGDIYTIKGYDKDFRICVVSESGKTITICENVYDTTKEMKIGKEFYENMLHLKENFKAMEYQTRTDWNNGVEDYKQFTGITENDINEFINALYNAPVINIDSNIYSHPAQLGINVKMQDGTTSILRVFINGYVAYYPFIVKIDDKITQKLFNTTELKGKFSTADVKESKYSISKYHMETGYYNYVNIGIILLLWVFVSAVCILIISKRSHSLNKYKIILVILSVAIVLWGTVFAIDFKRYKNNEEPLLPIKSIMNKCSDGYVDEHTCFGYKYVEYYRTSDKKIVLTPTWVETEL